VPEPECQSTATLFAGHIPLLVFDSGHAQLQCALGPEANDLAMMVVMPMEISALYFSRRDFLHSTRSSSQSTRLWLGNCG
jgi:hypothetical protein